MSSGVLTLITIIGTLWLAYFCASWLNGAYRMARDVEMPANRIVLSYVSLGLALSCFAQIGLSAVAHAHRQGGDWESKYVLHFPNAEDFWGSFVPAHLSFRGHNYEVQPDLALTFDLIGAGFMFLSVALFLAAKMAPKNELFEKRQSFTHFALWMVPTALLVFALVQIGLFLTAYLWGTFLFLGSLWKVVIGLMIVGLFGGGMTKIYDERGRHIGYIER